MPARPQMVSNGQSASTNRSGSKGQSRITAKYAVRKSDVTVARLTSTPVPSTASALAVTKAIALGNAGVIGMNA